MKISDNRKVIVEAETSSAITVDIMLLVLSPSDYHYERGRHYYSKAIASYKIGPGIYANGFTIPAGCALGFTLSSDQLTTEEFKVNNIARSSTWVARLDGETQRYTVYTGLQAGDYVKVYVKVPS